MWFPRIVEKNEIFSKMRQFPFLRSPAGLKKNVSFLFQSILASSTSMRLMVINWLINALTKYIATFNKKSKPKKAVTTDTTTISAV